MPLPYLLAAATLCCFCFVSTENLLSSGDDPEIFYNMIELVCSEGYYIQEHKVTTDDGYILTIYRIPNGNKHPKIPKKRNHYQKLHRGYHPDFAGCVSDSLNETSSGAPVLMAHGLTAASDCWVLQGPGYDLAFMLADKGYDVWFANIRGNFYSRKHKTLWPSEKAFWDFSFHENGIYDIPNTIDYILQLRRKPKLFYIGHSMGTTMFFVMASSKPEYNDKVHLFVGLTPASQLRRENFSQSRMVVFSTVINFVKAFGRHRTPEFIPRNSILNLFAEIMCTKESPFQDLCYDFGFFFTGYHSKLFLRKKLSLYVSHSLSGSSVKTFNHFEQLLDAPTFQCFDYGPEGNFERYAQAEPPKYDLKKVTVPVALYYSKGDYLVDAKDVFHLKKFLPNVVEDKEYAIFNHVDFIWAYNAKNLIYDKILQAMDRFRNQ